MYPKKGPESTPTGNGEERPAIEGIILDDDWTERRQTGRGGRGRHSDESELDIVDDSLLML